MTTPINPIGQQERETPWTNAREWDCAASLRGPTQFVVNAIDVRTLERELASVKEQNDAFIDSMNSIIGYCDGDIMYNHQDIMNIKSMANHALNQIPQCYGV